MFELGGLRLGGAPRVAVAVGEGVPRDDLDAAFIAGADLVELRIDHFTDVTGEHALEELGRLAGLPVLATIRSVQEGGGWKGGDDTRRALFETVIPHVGAIDIELSSRGVLEDVAAAAREAGKLVVGSFHDFERTPAQEELAGLALRAREAGVDILKIAAFCAGTEDVRRLAAFTLAQAPQGIITVGMGPHAMLSRIFFPALGSLITYTFLGTPTAPGQLNLVDTLRYLDAFYPERGGSGASGTQP